MSDTRHLFDESLYGPPTASELVQSRCNYCAHYWDSTCDATMPLRGARRPCKSFQPIRSINIPKKIEALRAQLNRCIRWCAVASILAVAATIISIL